MTRVLASVAVTGLVYAVLLAVDAIAWPGRHRNKEQP